MTTDRNWSYDAGRGGVKAWAQKEWVKAYAAFAFFAASIAAPTRAGEAGMSMWLMP